MERNANRSAGLVAIGDDSRFEQFSHGAGAAQAPSHLPSSPISLFQVLSRFAAGRSHLPSNGRHGDGMAVGLWNLPAHPSYFVSPHLHSEPGSDPNREVGNDALLPCGTDWERRFFFHGVHRWFQPVRVTRPHAHETALLHRVWDAWEVPRQARKESVREEADLPGCRMAGKLGRVSLSWQVVSELLSLTT